jgi:RHS repeat-associated protein
MKKQYLRILSALLVLCLTISIFQVTAPQKARAAEVTAVYNPMQGIMRAEIKYQYTQYAKIELWVDGSFYATLATAVKINGGGDLPFHTDDAFYTTSLPSGSPDGSLGVKALSGNSTCQISWTGSVKGNFINKDSFDAVIKVIPLGRPDLNKTSDPGKNYTWSANPAYAVEIRFHVSYGKKTSGDDINGSEDPNDEGGEDFDEDVDYGEWEDLIGEEEGKLTPEQFRDLARQRVQGSLTDEMIESMYANYKSGVRQETITFRGDSENGGDPVNLIDGMYHFSYVDLNLEGGVPLSFTRFYNSRYGLPLEEEPPDYEPYISPLGQGFTHGYEYRLTSLLDGAAIIVTLPYGEEQWFLSGAEADPDPDTPATGGGGDYFPLGDPGFTLEGDVSSGWTMTHEYGAKFIFNSDGQMTEAISPNNVSVAALTYDGDGRLTEIAGIAGSYTLDYDGEHISTVTDSAGRVSAYEYDGNNLIRVTNPDGDSVEYGYDANGFMNESKDFNGDVFIQNTYDELGRVTYQTFINANKETSYQFEYDDDALTTTYTNAQGHVTTYYYDDERHYLGKEDEDGKFENAWGSGRVNRHTDALNNETAYEFNENGSRVLNATLADGTEVAYTYDSNNRLTEISYPGGVTESYSYDGNGNMTGYTDKRGNTTTYTYNTTTGLPLTITDPEGGKITYTYDSNGRTTSVTVLDAGTTSYAYDDVGRVTEVTDANGNVTIYEYTDGGKLKIVTDALNHQTEYEHNGNGFITAVTDAAGGTTTTYGTNGQPLTQTDKNGGVTTYAYNSAGLLDSVTSPGGVVTKYKYNDKGLTTAIEDGAGNATRYEYDALDRVTKVIDPEGGVTSITYDAMGRTASVTDANVGQTNYTYDSFGRVVKTTDALGQDTLYVYDNEGNLTKVTDANGNATTSVYDKVGRVTTQTDAESYSTQYAYDKAGRLTALTNPIGGKTEYTYDPNGNTTQVKDPMGYFTYYTYDALNRVVEEKNDLGGIRRYVYDNAGNLAETYDELNRKTACTYDAMGNRLTQTDPMGNVTAFTYNPDNRQLTITYADGGVITYAYNNLGQTTGVQDVRGYFTQYTYDKNGRTRTVADAAGAVTKYDYDPVGNVTATYIDGVKISGAKYDKLNRVTESTDGNGNPAAYAYDKVGNVLKYTDREGNAATYEYFKNYLLKNTTDALGGITAYTYYPNGQTAGVTDANNHTTTYFYDANGNVTQVKDALGNSSYSGYDRLNRLTRSTNRRGETTDYAYDATGQITKITDALGNYTLYFYDDNGNIIGTINRDKSQTSGVFTSSYTYDVMNRQISTKNELNHVEYWAYDKGGNTLRHRDYNNHLTSYTYDGLNRVTSVTDAAGGLTEYAYNHFGNLTSATFDGGGNTRGITAFTYDGNGNILTETSPLGFVTSYAYDKENNITQQTLPNGKATNFSYSDTYLLTSRTDADDAAEFTYDPAGNMLTAVNSASAVTFTYDALDRVTGVKQDDSQVSYTYDAEGNRLTITYPDGKSVASTYDARGLIASLLDYDGTGVSQYVYDNMERLVKTAYTDGSTTEFAYNAAGLMTMQKEVDKSKSTLRQINYGYDDNGNLTTESRSGVEPARILEQLSYEYDRVDRLTRQKLEGVTTSYSYDAAGNLLSDGEYRYTYDVQNRLNKKTGSEGTYSYTYDNAGNRTEQTAPDGTTTSYEYNAQGKLTRGTIDGGEINETSEYFYNALSVRIGNTQVRENENYGYRNADLNNGSRRIKDYLPALSDERATWQRVWESEVTTTHSTNPERVTKTYITDLLSVANRDIMVTETGSFIQRYVYDALGKRVSAEFAHADGTARNTLNANGEYGENPASDFAVDEISKVWYRSNLTGSSLFVVDADYEVVAHAVYDAWGEPLSSTYTDANFSGLESMLSFTGYTWDVTLELYFAQARMYDASSRRFLQEDPIWANNLYIYCENNPLVRADPTGMYYIIQRADKKYDARKQNELDAIIAGAVSDMFNFSIQNVTNIWDGEAIVGGNSWGDPDIPMFDVEKAIDDFVNEVATQADGIYPGLGGAITIVWSLKDVILSLFTDVPAAIKIANRDDVIWKVFKNTSISPTNYSNLNAVTADMKVADSFVVETYDLFAVKREIIGTNVYDAGKAVVNSDIKKKDKYMDGL